MNSLKRDRRVDPSLSNPSDAVKEKAAGDLADEAFTHPEWRTAIAEANGISPLVAMCRAGPAARS